jgi:hypothetical protein
MEKRNKSSQKRHTKKISLKKIHDVENFLFYYLQNIFLDIFKNIFKDIFLDILWCVKMILWSASLKSLGLTAIITIQ